MVVIARSGSQRRRVSFSNYTRRMAGIRGNSSRPGRSNWSNGFRRGGVAGVTRSLN